MTNQTLALHVYAGGTRRLRHMQASSRRGPVACRGQVRRVDAARLRYNHELYLLE